MNPLALVKLKPLLKKFKESHPKFLMFVRKALKETDEGSIVEVKIKTSEGKEYFTNIKVSADDMELVNEMRNFLHS
ncbi:MAG: hypothetical protein K2J40_07795 [Ruminococcus sp.]|nr:hypothetical protein [Ruminococcus sp.]